MEDIPKQGWTSGPDTRGTFDILWTCLATLALCVWTAVHPNIILVPSFRRSLVSRLAMMLIAIVFPEFIISAAWSQLRAAQWLRIQINNLGHENSAANPKLLNYEETPKEAADAEALITPNLGENLAGRAHSSGSSIDHNLDASWRSRRIVLKLSATQRVSSSRDQEQTRQDIWTSEQAFFAVMGGFAIENDYMHPAVIRRLLTVDGVLQLAKMGILPQITPSDIEERSKADLIAKMFVLSQIVWFALQVIGRLVAKIPITLLETHTAIHVGCTIIIYFMWLKKPYDVRSSILLSSPEARDMGALFHFYQIATEIHAQTRAKYQRARVNYWKDRVVSAARNGIEPDSEPPPTPPIREALTTSIERCLTDPTAESTGSINETHLDRLAPSASRAIKLLKQQDDFVNETLSINTRNWDYLRANSENFTMRAVWGSWSTDTGHEMSLDKAVHFLFNFLYGGGHLAAWFSSSFPTVLEQWLWRGSAIMLALVPALGSLWVLWWKAARSKRRWLYVIRNGDLDIIVAPFFFVVMMTYCFARSFLLIESLAGLRLLPAGAFLKVEWARYIPHIA